ncbi:expressed unknown protein [Seminavis robusta]|uniref:Uncharacterized protein n=1 Tax=Seminavis robusta TaxID=568900 RepID=A0A9N8D7S1_9STRA|nr:expressed unknown protein [Seminavis robusta]|eukprot:Sro9_g007510.1 n/a (410) ;mRNA; r:170421-171650
MASPLKQSSRSWAMLALGASVFVVLTTLRSNLGLSVNCDSLLPSQLAVEMDIPRIGRFRESTKDKQQKSSRHATVMGMATNYDVGAFRRFVGSLRRSGYLGHIILAISPNPQRGVVEYLTSHNVTMKRLTLVNCSTDILSMGGETPSKMDSHAVEVMTCADPYPDLKLRWGRFALLRDYLLDCRECTGPVLVADVRDTYFQRDPFGPEAPHVQGLQVFEEHRTMRTTHWLVKGPVERCKAISIFDKPMLCSGTTVGTRDAMLRYLNDMVAEMRVWMQDPKCCCNKMNGDDQSIHNYLYYTQQLPYATSQRNRVGLVHTVGSQGAMLFNAKRKRNMEELNMTQRDASRKAYTSGEDEAKGTWLGLEHDLTDKHGFFIDFDGQRSFIIHQYDRFGWPMDQWLDRKSGLRDR